MDNVKPTLNNGKVVLQGEGAVIPDVFYAIQNEVENSFNFRGKLFFDDVNSIDVYNYGGKQEEVEWAVKYTLKGTGYLYNMVVERDYITFRVLKKA